ncbi:hypothetical protein [Mycobacterium sp. AT1]|uniref:hypothetical protein n=1 Tax=Mycobacterium sp. AT1 TaxID=1961706 RepID=UPI0013019E5A|nr:hypothetical protein [Mycobacterium sp. AT1]
MIEPDDFAVSPARESKPMFTPPVGDPSLELFGHGWSPTKAVSVDVGSYRGRHRAEN